MELWNLVDICEKLVALTMKGKINRDDYYKALGIIREMETCGMEVVSQSWLEEIVDKNFPLCWLQYVKEMRKSPRPSLYNHEPYYEFITKDNRVLGSFTLPVGFDRNLMGDVICAYNFMVKVAAGEHDLKAYHVDAETAEMILQGRE